MSTPEDQQSYAQGYHVGYKHGVEAGGNGGPPGPGDYPINVVARYPEQSSRWLMLFMLFKAILLIPHMIVIWFLGIGSLIAMIIAWFAVVINGRYPEPLWRYQVAVIRWQTRISAYLLGLTDVYPVFSLD